MDLLPRPQPLWGPGEYEPDLPFEEPFARAEAARWRFSMRFRANSSRGTPGLPLGHIATCSSTQSEMGVAGPTVAEDLVTECTTFASSAEPMGANPEELPTDVVAHLDTPVLGDGALGLAGPLSFVVPGH